MDTDDENISILREGLDLREIVSEKGSTFCVTNVLHDIKENAIYENDIPYEALKRNELLDDSILGLGFEEIGSRFSSLSDDNEVKKLVIKEGEGIVVAADYYVSVHYDCYLEYGDEPIDSSRCRNKSFSFKLGNFETIEGFEIAIRSMRKQEISAFLISPNYAFGEFGCPPRIPPNSTFLYLVELLNFEDNQDEYYRLPASERVKAPLDVMKKSALKFHKRGRELFREKNFLQAARVYQKELDILESHHFKDEEEENKIKELFKSLYENLALCNLKILNSGKCITYANLAMDLKGETSKLLYCKGKALRQLGQFSQAKHFLGKALKLLPKNAPECKDINSEIDKLERKWKMLVDFQTDAYGDLKISETNSDKDSFNDVFEKNIKMFKNDKDLIELPFLCRFYSPKNISKMKDIICKYDLIYKDYINEDGESEFHAIKTSADLSDNQALHI